jgi:autophagy-related protein 17
MSRLSTSMAKSPPLPSPDHRDSASAHAPSRSPLSVEDLVSYLVASKRSLGSIHLVHRATNILAEARSAIENTTALLAKATYLRRSLTSQLKILRGVQFELETAARGVQQDFQGVIKELDSTGAKLLKCIDLLKQTSVEDAFKEPDQEGIGASSAKDTLHDFVDDNGVETIKQAMEVTIDSVQQAQHEMNTSIQSLETDLQSINDLLAPNDDLSGTDSEIQQPMTMAAILSRMESHAREMAVGLESLVKHFDLCVAAIKHTEGGGEAVIQTMNAEEVSAVGLGLDELRAPTQPMNEEERVEMLQVLENDAQEVDDVAMELQDHHAEMEALLGKIRAWQRRQESAYNDVLMGFKLLDKISARLNDYVANTSRHAMKWSEEKAKIEDGISGMEELCEYYGNFLHAYDGLIVEVARRKAAKRQMEKIVADAHAHLEQLYETDNQMRRDFKGDHGEYLPSDIWSGINALPPKFAVVRTDEEDPGSIPELPRRVVEEALRRLKDGRTS